MTQNRDSMSKTMFIMVLAILISLSIVGTVSADYNMMDNCRQLAAGNGTTFYGSGMMGAGGAQMMESVEVNAMGQPMHDEMKGLVTKMMAGSLSSTDQARMVEIMNKYPGGSNMMMTRMMGGYGSGTGGYAGMMGSAGMMSAGSAQMMQSVEVSAMGQSMHDEMQGLVTKMMAGSLSSTDQARMVEIMNKYPGGSNMMMTRMMGGTGQGGSGYPGMMGTNGQNYYGMMGTGGVYSGAGMMDAGLMTGGSILIVLFFLVWLIVGILAIIWFVKQLQKDKIQS